jgi:transposase
MMIHHLLYGGCLGLDDTLSSAFEAPRVGGVAIARRRGAKRARVAVARKLAVVMYRMWVSGSKFETGVEKPKMAAA